MLTLVVLALACLAAAPATQSAPAAPEIFGAGILSAGEVYRGVFAPDGRTFYYFKKRR